VTGVLVIDKPAGITSFDVVREVRRALRVRRAGHTGTLDPLATGVLPICLGEATKIAGLLLAEDKAYDATALLGVETDTLDVSGKRLAERDAGGVSQAQLEAVLLELHGRQLQAPPAYSAIRSGGERAYERARRGEEVELAPREITVHRCSVRRWDPPRAELHFECSKGTYIRSLVAEVGRRLGCGATLAALRRLRSGPFDLARAVPLDELARRVEAGDVPLLSMDDALAHLPAAEVEAKDLPRLRQGQAVTAAGGEERAGLVRARSGGALVALVEWRSGKLWPKRVFGVSQSSGG
jgi:tRNA pseudouridine55 synthase